MHGPPAVFPCIVFIDQDNRGRQGDGLTPKKGAHCRERGGGGRPLRDRLNGLISF
jgi:hypothetical protein